LGLKRANFRDAIEIGPNIGQILKRCRISATTLQPKEFFGQEDRILRGLSVERLHIRQAMVICYYMRDAFAYQDKYNLGENKMKTMLKIILTIALFTSLALAGDMGSGGYQGCTVDCPPPPPCTENCGLAMQGNDQATDSLSTIVISEVSVDMVSGWSRFGL
jgi:hypothetical protein